MTNAEFNRTQTFKSKPRAQQLFPGAQVSSSIGDLQAQPRWASRIYHEHGYWMTAGSAIATWAVIASLT